MSQQSDQFLAVYDLYSAVDEQVIDDTINRAMLYISIGVYGDFYIEALWLKTAALLWMADYNRRTQNGIVSSRSVSGEYSVSYETGSNQFTKSTLVNPYEEQLRELGLRLGLGLGMILEL